MKLGLALRHHLLAMVGAAVVAILTGCATPVVQRGDLLRVTQMDGSRLQGTFVEAERDSIRISADSGGLTVDRCTIQGLELDERVRRPWMRPLQCVMAPLLGIAGVSQFRDDEGLRAVLSLTLAGGHAGSCLRSHVWVSAELPESRRSSTMASSSPSH